MLPNCTRLGLTMRHACHVDPAFGFFFFFHSLTQLLCRSVLSVESLLLGAPDVSFVGTLWAWVVLRSPKV